MDNEPWFESWFNTSYYHLLYSHRDENEARFFIKNLANKLAMPQGSKVLDLACGRGRHAVYLNEMGYDVTGLDLSEKNIQHARQFENKSLTFEVGDMREDYGKERFDYIFNLFTSFGYFNARNNVKACEAMARALKDDGILVVDFMNVNKVKLGLVEEEVRLVEGIEFHIMRTIRDDRVIKSISFTDKGRDYQYEEKVQLLDRNDFESLFRAAGLKIKEIFGDFELHPFDPDNSERLILFASVKP